MHKLSCIIIVLFLTLIYSTAVFAQELTNVRFGWQIPWAVQGQLVQVLKHTNILEKHGLKGEFIGRTYGPELNEVAFAGGVDVILTADQPAAALFAKDKGWKGIGRLMYNRTSTYVPVNSNIKTVSDLKGKIIGVPFGAAAERVLVESLIKNGLNPKKDVTIINLGMLEHAPLIKRSGSDTQKWDQFDALSGFDPIPAILESKDLVRTIDICKVVSLILTNKQFVESHPGVDNKIIAAFTEAYDFYRHNVSATDLWFLGEAKLNDADHRACKIASSLEPNLLVKNKKDIRLFFTDEDYALMQKGADFMEQKIKKHVNMKDFVFSTK